MSQAERRPSMTDEQADELLHVPYSYVQRPRPVSADVRPIWRVPYVLLLVRACRGGVATLSQLHVLNWGVRAAENSRSLTAFLSGEVEANDPVVRYEPALDRAVSLATGMGLLNLDGRRWRLTDSGQELLKDIDRDEELLRLERERLSPVTGLTQKAVRELLGRSA